MTGNAWLSLTALERELLQRALASYIEANKVVGAAALMAKLVVLEQYPGISIGVHVAWFNA